MTADRTVAIWRSHLLAKSETFLANQAAALQRWTPKFATLEFTNNEFGVRPAVTASSVTDPSLLELFRDSDLVHAHFAHDAIAIGPTVSAANRPLIATFHGFDVSRRKVFWSPRSRWGLRGLFRQAEMLVAVSGSIERRLSSLGAPSTKLVKHHIGVPIPLDEPRDHEAPEGGILFVGRLVEKKGCDDMLAALSALPAHLRSTPVTVIGDGPLRAPLERMAGRAGLDAVFRGAQTNAEVHLAMRQATLLCAPSRRARDGDAEGLPITVLEAAALRLPVVSTTTAGIPEAIENGTSGILVKEGDRRGLTGALATMLVNSDMRRSMAAAARARVERDFDVRKQTAKLEDLYDSILA